MSQNLYQIQQDFCQSMLDTGEDMQVLKHVAHADSDESTSGLTSTDRFRVYKNNMFSALIDVLAGTYPVTQELVGEEFFTTACQNYIRQFPPKSALLLEYGSEFPIFIETYKPVAELGYLADVARLEYNWLQSYHAADSSIISAQILADIDPEQLPFFGCKMHPSLRLIHSSYAVGTIWHEHQSDITETLSIDVNQPEWLAIIRPEYEVSLCFLDQPGYQFLQCLIEGMTLADAIASAMDISPSWDAGSALAFSLQHGFFADLNR